MKRFKSYLRSTSSSDRMISLMILATESELLLSLTFKSIIIQQSFFNFLPSPCLQASLFILPRATEDLNPALLSKILISSIKRRNLIQLIIGKIYGSILTFTCITFSVFLHFLRFPCLSSFFNVECSCAIFQQ